MNSVGNEHMSLHASDDAFSPVYLQILAAFKMRKQLYACFLSSITKMPDFKILQRNRVDAAYLSSFMLGNPSGTVHIAVSSSTGFLYGNTTMTESKAANTAL